MSSLAEAGLVIVVIGVVIGLATRNRTLKKEKEQLFKQLSRMLDEEQGEKIAASMQANAETAKVPETTQSIPAPGQTLESGNSVNTRWTHRVRNTSCPDCGSTEFEMRTYGGPMEYADTHCAKCGRLICRFDAA
jgi:hypothetical protein